MNRPSLMSDPGGIQPTPRDVWPLVLLFTFAFVLRLMRLFDLDVWLDEVAILIGLKIFCWHLEPLQTGQLAPSVSVDSEGLVFFLPKPQLIAPLHGSHRFTDSPSSLCLG